MFNKLIRSICKKEQLVIAKKGTVALSRSVNRFLHENARSVPVEPAARVALRKAGRSTKNFRVWNPGLANSLNSPVFANPKSQTLKSLVLLPDERPYMCALQTTYFTSCASRVSGR